MTIDISQVKRQESESFNAYHVRLFDNMNEYNIDKFEVADLLNAEMGSTYDESKWRKDYALYKKWKDFIISQNLDEEIVKKYKEIEWENEKKKIRYQDQRKERQKFVREEARMDEVLDVLKHEVQQLNKSKPLHWLNKLEYNNNSNKAGALLISDWHKGLFTISYWNEFNDAEFYRRVNLLTNEVISYGKFHKIKKLYVFQIGDLIHGMIHRLTRIMDTEDAVRATMSVAETLSEMISLFANEFEEIEVYNARGNHERVNPNKGESIGKESFNDFIPWFMKERLAKFNNVKILDNLYDDEIIVTEILGHTIFAVHGHRDSLGSIISDLTLMIKKFPEYVFSAHIHKNYENESHEIDHISNSCLSGVDDYAKDIRKTSKPAQKFMIFDFKKGRECTYSIVLK